MMGWDDLFCHRYPNMWHAFAQTLQTHKSNVIKINLLKTKLHLIIGGYTCAMVWVGGKVLEVGTFIHHVGMELRVSVLVALAHGAILLVLPESVSIN